MTADNNSLMPELVVDARGTLCPEPILAARRALRELDQGSVFAVIATDEHAQLDFEAFCARTGHELIATKVDAGEWTFTLRKCSAP